MGGSALVRGRPRGAPDRRRADLRRARQRRPRGPSGALPRGRRRGRAAGLLLREGAALGQPDLRLARDAPPRLPLLGGALPPDVRPLRPRPGGPLPRVHRLLGDPARRPRRPPRPVGPRPGPRAVRRRAPRARAAADHRGGPRRHHPARRAPARRARLPGHGRPAVRLQPRRPEQPARRLPPPRASGPLHGHARQRHAARLVREPSRPPPRRVAGRRRRRPHAVVGPHRHRPAVPGAPVHAPGPGRARARQRGADEPPGHRDRQLALPAAAGTADEAPRGAAAGVVGGRGAGSVGPRPPTTIAPPMTTTRGLVALGDSITNGHGEPALGVHSQSWAQWLAEALELPFTKLAADGARAADVLRDQVPRLRGPYDLACVYAGVNDVRSLDFGAAGYERDLRAIATAAGAAADRLALCTLPTDLGRPRAAPKTVA